MATAPNNELDEQVERALDELRSIIRRRFPEAQFEVFHGEDPEGTYLSAIVDVEDSDEVVDVFIDRLIDMQVEDGLPVYVVPVRPLERVLEEIQRR